MTQLPLFRHCYHCNTSKPYLDFSPRGRYCRPCEAEKANAYYHSSEERRQKHIARVRVCQERRKQRG
jgi:recombinational DNA repair protein (RecF pathway)